MTTTPQTLQQKISSVLARLFGAAALIMTIIWANTKDTDEKYLGGLNWDNHVFNWHPILMVAGLLFFFVNGVLAYRGTMKCEHNTNKSFHGLSFVAAIVCLSVGLKAVWRSHDDTSSSYVANLYSLHSMIGLAAVVMFGQNFLLGALHFLSPAMTDKLKKSYMPNHVILGICTFVLAVMAIVTGILEKNTFIGCNYAVTEKDVNPAENYHKLPDGCKLSNGIGIVSFLTMVLTLYSLYDIPKEKVGTDEAPLLTKV